jgi:hypothetical protein
MGQFVIDITACPIRGVGKHIPADVVARLYRDAVTAEMSESVKRAVIINSRGDDTALTDGLKVRLSTAAKRQVFGAVTNKGMSYMFQLRDAVAEVIRMFVPPAEAWVADPVAPHPLFLFLLGVLPMEASTSDQAQASTAISSASTTSSPVSGKPPVPGKLDESHIPTVATAIQAFHFPHIPIEEIINPSSVYINEAKSFIAALNAVVDIFSQLQAGRQAQLAQQQEMKLAQSGVLKPTTGAPAGQDPQTGASSKPADPNPGSAASANAGAGAGGAAG